MPDTNKVETTRKEYDTFIEQWERCRDAADGSDAVKAKKEKYLPGLDSHAHDTGSYDAYLLRALYYNAVGRTVQGLAGSVFQKSVSVKVPSVVDAHLKDITLTGQPLEQFGLDMVKDHLITGKNGILVDMSAEPSVTPRPYWSLYKAEDIINWRYSREGGDEKLVFVVLRESVEIFDGEFEVRTVPQYRVLRLRNGVYTTQLYTKDKKPSDSNKEEFTVGLEITPQRRGQPLTFIPFSLPWATYKSPIIDLVDVALSHYRSSADLKHGLHYTALPTPWIAGAAGNPSEPMTIGSCVAWSLDVGGQCGMLEFSGSGLNAIAQDMESMRVMMSSLGARLIEEQAVRNESSTTASMRNAGDHASLRLVVQIVEQQLTWAAQCHAWWLGVEATPNDVDASIALNKDFFSVNATSEEVKTLMGLLQADAISYATFYHRLESGGWTREGVNAEEEQEEIVGQNIVKPLPAIPPGQEQQQPGEQAPPKTDDVEAEQPAEAAQA